MMNYWKLTVILLAVFAVALLAAATLFEWDRFDEFGWMDTDRFEQQRPPAFLHDRPPTLMTSLGAFFTFFLSGVFVLYLLPDHTKRIKQVLASSPGDLVRLTLSGLLAGVLLIAIGVSSALSMGTFPLILFLGSLLFLSTFLGFVALSYGLGNRLLRKAGWDHLSPIYALLLGLLVLFSISQIPYLGLLFQGLAASLSLGAVIATRFGTGRPWNLAPLLEE